MPGRPETEKKRALSQWPSARSGAFEVRTPPRSVVVAAVALTALPVVAVFVALPEGEDAQGAGQEGVVAGLDGRLHAHILQAYQSLLHVDAVAAVVVATVVVIVVAVVVAGVPVVAVAPVVVAVVTGECQRARHQQASGSYREDDSSLLEHGVSP